MWGKSVSVQFFSDHLCCNILLVSGDTPVLCSFIQTTLSDVKLMPYVCFCTLHFTMLL